jgi:hypothetical protein
MTEEVRPMFDRQICDWIRAATGTIMSGCAIIAIIGAWNFASEIRKTTDKLVIEVQIIKEAVAEGILPKASERMGRIEEQIRHIEMDVQKIERMLDDGDK